MSATKWGKFFWADWSNDPKLKLCSLAARGLWMQMLCIAAESDPVGYVAIVKTALGAREIARIAGADVSEVETLLSELERNDVFSRTSRGTIYSRRMTRDEKKAKIARENGKNGGNPNLRKQTDFSASDKGLSTTPLVIPYARSQTPEIEANPKGPRRLKDSVDPQADRRSDQAGISTGGLFGDDEQAAPVNGSAKGGSIASADPGKHGSPVTKPPRAKDDEPEGFAEFYDAYPRKVGRKEAAKAFAKALKSVPVPKIMAGLAAYRRGKPEYADWKHPASWLNGERWNDQYAGAATALPPVEPEAPNWETLISILRGSGVWHHNSPEPGMPGCKVPAEILKKYHFEPRR